MFFYSDMRTESVQINVWKLNGTKCYLNHYNNYLMLQFIASNERSSVVEKLQARKELTICERKLEYWQRHPNYVHEDAVKGVARLKRDWNVSKGATE